MKTLMKTTLAAVATSGMILSGMAAPMAASAHDSYVCKVEKQNSAKTGLILGAVVGGLLGSQVSKNERGLGAVGGAVIGGALGNKLGKDKGKDTCNKIKEQAREEARYGYGEYRTRYEYNRRTGRYEPVRYYETTRYGSRY